MIGEQKSDNNLIVSCKIPAQWAELLNIIADMRGSDVNNLLKMCIAFLIETARVTTEASPDMKVLLNMMKVDANWSKMFNYVTNAQLDIAQVILVLQQHDGKKPKKGFGLAMFNKPYCGDITQTLCKDDILERVVEITMNEDDYSELRRIGDSMDSKSVRETLSRMIDAQTISHLDEMDAAEMPGLGEHNDIGRTIEYGRKAKGRKHRTPDSVADDQRYQQTHIVFDDYDREIAGYEAESWEGVHHQDEPEPPEGYEQNEE
jgi:hypothetical protein